MICGVWRKESSMVTNLQHVRDDIKRWKLHTFDQVIELKKEIMARLNVIQVYLQGNCYKPGLRKLEQKLQMDLNNI